MELSNVGENVLNPNATPEPTEKPDNTTRTIDFDTYTLSHKQTWQDSITMIRPTVTV